MPRGIGLTRMSSNSLLLERMASDLSEGHADDERECECRNAEGQSPAPPVDLGWQRALRFKIQHVLTVRPGHCEMPDLARRVALFAGV